MPLFGAEGLRQLERVTEEIARNGRAGQKHQPALPLFTTSDQATAAPGAWTGWSTKYNWVSRRAAYVEFTVRECQDAIQIGLVQIRKRLIDAANELLDNGGVPAVRAASRVIVENFPPVARVADVSDGEQIEDLSDIPDADIDRMKAIRDAARAKNEQTKLEE